MARKSTKRRCSGSGLQAALLRGIALRTQTAGRRLAAARRHPSTESTHGVSTSLRRLIVVDRVVRDLYGKGFLGRHRRAIQAVRRSLGAVRDAQEIQAKYAALNLHQPAAAAYGKHLADRKALAQRHVIHLMKGLTASVLARATGQQRVRTVLDRSPRETPGGLLAKLLRRLREWQKDAIDKRDDWALHRLRVAFKRFRYTYELLTPEITGGTPAALAYLKSLQEIMGEAHDCLVLEEDLRAWRAATRKRHALRAVVRLVARQRRAAHDKARGLLRYELDLLDRFTRL